MGQGPLRTTAVAGGAILMLGCAVAGFTASWMFYTAASAEETFTAITLLFWAAISLAFAPWWLLGLWIGRARQTLN